MMEMNPLATASTKSIYPSSPRHDKDNHDSLMFNASPSHQKDRLSHLPQRHVSTPRAKSTSALDTIRNSASLLHSLASSTPENGTYQGNKNKKRIVSMGGDDMSSLRKHHRHSHQQFGSRLRSDTILSHRHYKAVCTFSIMIFIVLHLMVGLNRYLAESPLCPYDPPGSPWIRDINIFTAGGLVFAMFLQMNRIQLSTFREHNDIGTMSSYFASLCVNFISGISHISIVFWDWGGNCKDAYG